MRCLSLLALIALPACQHLPRTPSAWSEPAAPRPTVPGHRASHSDAISLPSGAEREYELSLYGTQPHQRFEYARRDYLISRRVPAPILATNEWPTPIPNEERPVWFYYWRQ